MAIKIQADGTFSIEYEGPYAGLDVENPATLISDKSSPALNGFMLRNAEIRSWPAFTQFPGNPLAGQWPLGVSTFLDANGTYHTVYWQNQSLYQYTGSAWILVGQASPGNMQTNPVSYRSFANIIWYTDVGFIAGPHGTNKPPVITPFLGYWDGIAAAPVFTQTFSDASTSQSVAGISLTDSPTVGGGLPGGPTITGPIAIGGGYLAELNNFLLLANVTIKDQGTGTIYTFPNMIWWSANGLPKQWDPTQNTSAGFNPFLDVADQITGLVTSGIAGFIFRTYGITQMTPTGSAVAPWEFDHMWASEHGIGNVLPWSIAQYGPTAAFASQDNIYSLSITSASAIGGKARDAIFADIANATSTPFANILPVLKDGYVYLTYVLLIPFLTFVRQYTYSFEDQNWEPRDLPLPQVGGSFAQLTCAPNVV